MTGGHFCIASHEQQQAIVALVDKILAAKEILRCAQNDGIADTSVTGGHVERSETSIWEKQIDTLVYELYGLSAEEIAIIDNNVNA